MLLFTSLILCYLSPANAWSSSKKHEDATKLTDKNLPSKSARSITSEKTKPLTYKQKMFFYNLRRKSALYKIVGGWVIFGISYGTCLAFALSNLNAIHSFTAVSLSMPLLGPFVLAFSWIGEIQKSSSIGNIFLGFGVFMCLGATAIQTFGFAFAVYETFQYKKLRKPKRTRTVTLLPWFQQRGGGLALQGFF